MFLKRQLDEASPQIDLTPVIDIVFLLLIFFLVATTFAQQEREMKIVLPEAASAGPISAVLREIVINVDAEGQVIVAGRVLSDDDLRALVRDALAQNPQQKVTVRGDQSVHYGRIAQVLDICRQEGVGEPFLDTVPIR